MANGDTSPSRLGQVNAAGDAKALFLKVFGGEVLKTFLAKTVMLDRVRTRRLSHGKVAQFPVIGEASASFHAAGEDILDSGNSYLSNIKKNEKLIYVDEPLQASAFITDIDDAMNHYDVRSEYASRLGSALAITYDKYALQTVGQAARASATISGGDGGLAITDADADTNSSSLIDSISAALQNLDEKNVPMEDRMVMVRPAQYHLLLNDSTNNANRFNLDKDIGSEGSFSKGKVGNILGAQIIMSNHVPITDLSSAITGDNNDYSANFSTTVALVFQKEAIGSVILRDMKVEHERKATHLGDFVVAHLMTGFGILRPECAVEIKTA